MIGMGKFNTKFAVFTVLLFSPLWLCLLFRFLPLGSIGPAVPLTWVVNSFLLPVMIFHLANEIGRKRIRSTIKGLAIPAGLILAYLQFISYMPLTYVFGLYDFNWI